jgi:hypothetical protein
MPNRRQALAYDIYFFIQLLYAIIQAEIQLEETNRQRRLKLLSTLNQPDEALEAILLIQSLPNRRWWMAPQSHGWCQMVLDGEMLQEEEFRSTFRMTRNSFNQLHALLGT